ncbi:PP2C family protein-serine/threonine phosphatase [Leisingera sp. S232]|uniref:PP2C family protein-serine/threonine phosphatase n=1 Tax=Leisingera sp. S232 TaxID=3415132 RepID=UPI003C7B31DF
MSRVAGKQILGRRDKQEDSFVLKFQDQADPGSDVLMVVADGMGGHVGGEIASQVVCDSFADYFVRRATEHRTKNRLQAAAEFANKCLGSRIAEERELKGMGCTLVGVLKVENRLSWVSIGDSPAYLHRAGRLWRINADHSLYAELLEGVRAGKLTQEEADVHPKRHALRSALLGTEIPLVDLNSIDLQPGDCVILATDGVETLSLQELQHQIERSANAAADAVAANILAAVEAKGKPRQDNTTVLVYKHTAFGQPGLLEPTGMNMSGRRFSAAIVPLIFGGSAIALGAVLVLAYALNRKEVPPLPTEPAIAPTAAASEDTARNRPIERVGGGGGSVGIEDEPLGRREITDGSSQGESADPQPSVAAEGLPQANPDESTTNSLRPRRRSGSGVFSLPQILPPAAKSGQPQADEGEQGQDAERAVPEQDAGVSGECPGSLFSAETCTPEQA